jgi:hypothetical protein
VVLGIALVLVLLLTVWSAFLVPLHAGSTPVPLWLLPFAGMLAIGTVASRRLGLAGALAPALLWLAVGVLGFGSRTGGGDLVVPPSLSGYAYLFGGTVAWAAVVLRASAAERGDAPAAMPVTSPAPPQRASSKEPPSPAPRRRR